MIGMILISQNTFATTLSEALLQAYINNPELNAERENIKVSKEDLNISRSEFLPTVTVSSSRSKENTEKLTNRSGANSSFTDVDPKTQSLIIEQKLFQGFSGIAEMQKSKIGLSLADAKLLKTEQEILYKAVEAYSGLVFSLEKLKINERNVSLLERQVETDQARLERAQITLADLAQSESSLAGAQAKFIQAKNETITSKLFYEKIKKDVIIARSDFSPSATLSLSSTKTDDTSSTINERDKEIAKATISWPIFKGGKSSALLNKSKNLQNRKKLLFDNAIKTNDTSVASAWSNLQSSKSLLNSVNSQVKAAEIANEGITVEYESGLGRSTLDVIQSNSILLTAKTSLAESERNYLLSQFKLLQLIGLLKNDYLKLK